MNKNFNITSIILLVLSAVLALGSVFVFHACPAKDDGTFMSCHWAERVVCALGCIMTIISSIHLFSRNSHTKLGLSLALLPVSIYTALVPGIVINLCIMADMRCRTTLRPAVVLLSVLIAAAAAADAVLQYKRSSSR